MSAIDASKKIIARAKAELMQVLGVPQNQRPVGITGISFDGRHVIVYVVSNNVQVPPALAGFPVLKKVSGPINLKR